MMKAPVINRKLLVLLGPVVALGMFGMTVMMASSLMNREYKMPYRASAQAADQTPRAAGVADIFGPGTPIVEAIDRLLSEIWPRGVAPAGGPGDVEDR